MPFKGKWKKREKIPTYAPILGEGPLDASIMLVGERPGIDEDNAGRPFVGPSGQALDYYLDSVGLRREDIYVTNLVKTYSPDSPTQAEISDWEGVLRDEVAQINPLIIGAVGVHSASWLLEGSYLDLDTQHGLLLRSSKFDEVLVVPIFHPASAFYNPESGKFIQYDFQSLAAAAQGDLVEATDTHPDPAYRTERPNIVPVAPYIAIDTEGSYAQPWCLSWSTQPGTAYCQRTVGCQGEWKPRGHVLLHNSLHDLSVLNAMGVKLEDGQFTDTMVLAYLLGVEPQGLKALAYRHCGMRMKSYDDVLSTANQCKALEYLYGVCDIDWPDTEPYAIVVKGELKVKNPWSINRYIKRIISDYERDPSTDIRARWDNIEDYIKQPVVSAVGPMEEATLDDIPEEKAVEYACRDADATLRIHPHLLKRVQETEQELISQIDHSIIPMVDRMQRHGFLVDREHFRQLANKCDIIMAQEVAAIEQITGCHINPNSSDQTATVLFDVCGLEPTKFTEGGKRSTQDKVLESLRHQHPVVPHVLDFREASKVKDSFCVSLPRYISSDNRLRPNMRITRVSSGRMSCTNPNLMAIPVRSALGREVRNGFVAAPGHVLATWDLNQVEMRHMAHMSADPLLCQLFLEGKRDVHGETGARMFGVPYELAMLPENAMLYRYPAKRVGFGVITGISGVGLLDQMKLAGAGDWTEEACDKLIEDWFSVYPAVKNYMEGCKAQTRRYGYMRDMWGRIRHLPGIHSHIRHIKEEAGRQSHSHDIQAGAQGIMKVGMAAIWRELKHIWADGWFAEPKLQIHDEIIFELDDHPVLWEIMNEMVVRCLTKAHLEFFPDYRAPLKAKGAFGARWGELEK